MNKSVSIFVGMQLLVATPAFADNLEDLQRINKSIDEIARQRDEAIAQRDYWANRDCQDQHVMRFPQSKDIKIDPSKTTVLQIQENADSKTEYTVVDSAPPGISICILRVGGECVLNYDGGSKSLIASIPLNIKVER